MSTEGLNIAVVGATGVVGEMIITLLGERSFPVKRLAAVASERSLGKTVRFNGKTIAIETLDDFDFSSFDIAFFSAGSKVSSEAVGRAAESGCIVIDNTACFRYDPDVPLVIPEVNPDAIADYRARNIIANPNCSTIQMLVALKPIYDAVGIKRINVSTYQSVSGAGRAAVSELASQTANLLSGQSAEPAVFSQQIAFNVIPQIDVMTENGYTKEEMKMFWETQKIFCDPDIVVNATAVRVPVFYGHSEAVHIETVSPITAEDARSLLSEAPGVTLLQDTSEYPTAISHGTNEDAVFVGRVREDLSHDLGLNLWVVSDNIRKGAALNAIQIAELLVLNKFYV